MRTTRVLVAVIIMLVIVISALLASEFISPRPPENPPTGTPQPEKITPSNSSINDELKNTNVTFTTDELRAFQGIKNRIITKNTDPNFPSEYRVLEWISLRNSSSASWDNYSQKSMEYLCFWKGQGVNGEWEAVISIYNSPNSTSDFVVEVARFTWHSLEVTLDGNVKVSFPQVTSDTTSSGYATFHVLACT
jgi:hypothetical protein